MGWRRLAGEVGQRQGQGQEREVGGEGWRLCVAAPVAARARVAARALFCRHGLGGCGRAPPGRGEEHAADVDREDPCAIVGEPAERCRPRASGGRAAPSGGQGGAGAGHLGRDAWGGTPGAGRGQDGARARATGGAGAGAGAGVGGPRREPSTERAKRVRPGAAVGVAAGAAHMAASGRPTTSLRLTTTTVRPCSCRPTGAFSSNMPSAERILATASGVHGSTHFLPLCSASVRMLWYSAYR